MCLGFLVNASFGQQQLPSGMTPALPSEDVWMENLQMGAVRVGNCSAAFVTDSGLIATSYECAWRHVRTAWRIEHIPLDEGFHAVDFFDERRVSGLVADQLVEIREARSEVLADTVWEAEDGLMLTEFHAFEDSTRFLAYTYRRYEDVRVVWMPERAVGAFGGEMDESTYPRYSLGVGLLRAYDREGYPVSTENYLPLSGVSAMSGETLYSIGTMGLGPQVSEGAVGIFEYNGTWAPPFTTLFGLYDLHFSHGAEMAWDLPEAWLESRDGMNLSVQLNIVTSTLCAPNGAPLVNADLEVVGIAFDHVKTDNEVRCVGVSGAAIYEVLQKRYGADGLVAELEAEGIDE